MRVIVDLEEVVQLGLFLSFFDLLVRGDGEPLVHELLGHDVEVGDRHEHPIEE